MKKWEREVIRMYLSEYRDDLRNMSMERIAHEVREKFHFGAECTHSVIRGIYEDVDKAVGFYEMTVGKRDPKSLPVYRRTDERSSGDDVLAHMFDTEMDSSSIYAKGEYLKVILNLEEGESHTIRETPPEVMDRLWNALQAVTRKERPGIVYIIRRYPHNGNVWIKRDDGRASRSKKHRCS